MATQQDRGESLSALDAAIARQLVGVLHPGLPAYDPMGNYPATLAEMIPAAARQGYDCGRADIGRRLPALNAPTQYNRQPANIVRKMARHAWEQGYAAGIASGDPISADSVGFHDLTVGIA